MERIIRVQHRLPCRCAARNDGNLVERTLSSQGSDFCDRGDLSRLGKCLAYGTDNNAFNTDCHAAARLAMTETWWNAPCHREGAPLRGDRGDLSRLGKCLAYGTDNNAFNTDCYAAARLAMTETWWNAPCHREGAPLRGDRGDLSRLGKCLAYGTDNTRSTQIAMPLRGSQ
ncbi:MAG: hypothetical protein ACYCYG_14070 [Bellilinea sp.]